MLNYFYNTLPMQTQITSFLPKTSTKSAFIKTKVNRRGISKIMKDIILESNRKHNGGRLKCQYCKQNIRFTGRQKRNCSVMFNYVYPKEHFKSENDYYGYYNCVACCRRCHLLKKEKPYSFLVNELMKKNQQIPFAYEIPMILD